MNQQILIVEYLNGSITVLMMYKLLFSLKRVEFQINPKYDDIREIVQSLKRQIRTERCLLALFISCDLLNFIIAIFSIIGYDETNFGFNGRSEN